MKMDYEQAEMRVSAVEVDIITTSQDEGHKEKENETERV